MLRWLRSKVKLKKQIQESGVKIKWSINRR